MCDASAAVALDEDLFAVGDDEDHALRIFSRHPPGPPLFSLDLSLFLGLRLGDPILLDLGGLGIRSIEFVEGRYFIIGGTLDGRSDSWIYEWDGSSPKPRRLEEVQFGDINPEALTYCGTGPDRLELLVVSDDGTVKVGPTDCKRLGDSRQKQFRSVTVRLR